MWQCLSYSIFFKHSIGKRKEIKQPHFHLILCYMCRIWNVVSYIILFDWSYFFYFFFSRNVRFSVRNRHWINIILDPLWAIHIVLIVTQIIMSCAWTLSLVIISPLVCLFSHVKQLRTLKNSLVVRLVCNLTP